MLDVFHAATSAGSDAYCYDQNGNMVKRTEGGVTYTQNFNAENMITSVMTGGQTTAFGYDGDSQLVKKVNPDGTYTVYLGVYEVEYNASNVATKKTSYYPGGAMRVDIPGGSNTLYFLLKDHLSSASTLLDTAGNVVMNGEQRYYPFGESRITGASLPTDRMFQGQREVGGLGGLYHFGARFYLGKLGRFISADTIVPSFANPQSLNRYAFVLNNPLKYVDPTGHRAECSGTDAFISESHNDGGISWASCWAIQRDKNSLLRSGASEKVAETIATGKDAVGTAALEQLLNEARSFGPDAPYLVDFIDITLNTDQREALLDYINMWENIDQWFRRATFIGTIGGVLAKNVQWAKGIIAIGEAAGSSSGFVVGGAISSEAYATMIDELEELKIRLLSVSADETVRFTVGTNIPSPLTAIPYHTDPNLGTEFVPYGYVSWGMSVNGEQVTWNCGCWPSFSLTVLMIWRWQHYEP